MYYETASILLARLLHTLSLLATVGVSTKILLTVYRINCRKFADLTQLGNLLQQREQMRLFSPCIVASRSCRVGHHRGKIIEDSELI
ncbi:hypothetical protein BDU57DRAFT_40098 [Ampelomyces quisqualis]|uniref:Uncharacterized protein n=1 Tax=Ampelomyces quisqualis TaxID=50730 RepID=A0A6A5QZD9_AMPQU|nr:hypothetical protein BDU57DRAFT_40098 [Ampelomyces quisqualis]